MSAIGTTSLVYSGELVAGADRDPLHVQDVDSVGADTSGRYSAEVAVRDRHAHRRGTRYTVDPESCLAARLPHVVELVLIEQDALVRDLGSAPASSGRADVQPACVGSERRMNDLNVPRRV